MLTCKDFSDFLMSYLDGDLAGVERESFDAHVEACPECLNYLDSYRATVELGKSVCGTRPDGPVPDDVPEALVHAILAARRASRS